jgi:cysteine protease ATG4
MQDLNVGILGGRPKEAYYLVGIQDDHLIFLDPHNTQEAIPGDINLIKSKHMTYHESTAKKIHYSKLDPSFGFAFLIKSSCDYLNF